MDVKVGAIAYHMIEQIIMSNQQVLIYIDFAKAFDTVPTNVMCLWN